MADLIEIKDLGITYKLRKYFLLIFFHQVSSSPYRPQADCLSWTILDTATAPRAVLLVDYLSLTPVHPEQGILA